MRKLLNKMDNVLSERKIRKKLSIIVIIIIMSFLLFVGNAKAYNIEFKSYYVVWKHRYISGFFAFGCGLNRTM